MRNVAQHSCMSPLWRKEEVLKIRNKIDVFAEELQGFCHEFREKCPFDPSNAVNGEYDLSYETMNEQPDFSLGRRIYAHANAACGMFSSVCAKQ